MINFKSCFLLIFFCHQLEALNSDEILIIVSYDAFRKEYFQRNVTDFMNSLRNSHTKAEYLRNVFPTKTFPNHHSIATGVFPNEHGVLANNLYDSKLRMDLNYSFDLYHFRSEILPIWTLNEIAGGHSGCMMWPGSDYEYNNIFCTHNRHYNLSVNFKDRVDEAFDWIFDKTSPANLVMFYVEEPDTHAHAFGPESQKITDLVAKLNEVTEYMYQKIQDHKLEKRVNVIHLSDHGMDSLTLGNVIDLQKILKDEKVKFYGTTPVLQIVPDHADDTNSIYAKLKREADSRKTFKVYINSTLPERWHFNNNYRTGPITAVADLGYGFQDMYDSAVWYKKAYNVSITPTTKYGVHGYDNSYESMHPIFFAYGNLIKTNNVVAPFDTVDLFYLFTEILGLDPPSYLAGNRDNILGILKYNHDERKFSRWIVLGISIIASSVLVSTFLVIAKFLKRHRNVPHYLYEEDTTILDDAKLPSNYTIHTSSDLSVPSTSFQVL